MGQTPFHGRMSRDDLAVENGLLRQQLADADARHVAYVAETEELLDRIIATGEELDGDHTRLLKQTIELHLRSESLAVRLRLAHQRIRHLDTARAAALRRAERAEEIAGLGVPADVVDAEVVADTTPPPMFTEIALHREVDPADSVTGWFRTSEARAARDAAGTAAA
jgi:hypothetical protein